MRRLCYRHRVGTLHLYAGAEMVEARWRALLPDGAAVELGVGHATLAELIEAAGEAARPSGMRVGVLGERVLVDAVAEEAGGPFARIARSRGLRRSAAAARSRRASR
jgi:hypothetical protein